MKSYIALNKTLDSGTWNLMKLWYCLVSRKLVLVNAYISTSVRVNWSFSVFYGYDILLASNDFGLLILLEILRWKTYVKHHLCSVLRFIDTGPIDYWVYLWKYIDHVLKNFNMQGYSPSDTLIVRDISLNPSIYRTWWRSYYADSACI